MKAKTVEEFDQLVNEGHDVFDIAKTAKPVTDTELFGVQKVNVNFPVTVVRLLDRAADRRGITRQSLIKSWLVDRLDEEMTIVRGADGWYGAAFDNVQSETPEEAENWKTSKVKRLRKESKK